LQKSRHCRGFETGWGIGRSISNSKQCLTFKTAFLVRGELELREEQTASAEHDDAEGGSSSLREKKSVSKSRKKKSKRRMERNATLMQSYVQRMAPLRVPRIETGEGEAFAFVCAVIRWFQKTIRTIFGDGARVGQMQIRQEEHSEDEHQAAPAPPSSDRRRGRRRRRRASEEPDSRESPWKGTEEPGSRLDSEAIMVDQKASEPSAERRIRELQDRNDELEQRNDHLKRTNTVLRDRIWRWNEKDAAESDELHVFVRCGKKTWTLPWGRDQKWASLRKLLIRTFKLKNAYWELEERQFEAVGDDGWRKVLSPSNQPGRDMEYRIVRIRGWRRRAPGMSDRSRTTHGRPRNEWKVVYQRQGGPAATESAPRPDRAPPLPADGPKAGGVGRRGAARLIERNESACTGREKVEGQSRGKRATEDIPTPNILPGAREKYLPPPAEDRPQATSTLKKGNLEKEDKPNKPIPKEAERVADRLLYGTPKAKGSEAGTVQDRQDPGWAEWVVQWT
jgi:hypothetical protein